MWIWCVWGRREIFTGLWYEYLKEGACLEEIDIDGRIILKKDLNPLKTKRRVLYLKAQFVPCCKHFISVIKTNQFML